MNLDMRNPDGSGNNRSPFLGHREPIDDPKHHDTATKAPAVSTGKTLAHWETFEHEPTPTGTGTLRIALVALLAIVAYALYTNSPLMAIVFILIGMVGYLLMNRPPEITPFSISDKGVTVGKEFYGYDDIRSFWILENHPDFPKHLIIQTDGALVSHVHVPLAEQRPDAIRDILLRYVPEKKYEPGLIDTIEKMFHI